MCAGAAFRLRNRKEQDNAGRDPAGGGAWVLRPVGRLHLRLRAPVKEVAMLFEYVLGGAVTAGILVYLTYALLRPEKL
jgi:K+-transporting ATPase KdpF subunit